MVGEVLEAVVLSLGALKDVGVVTDVDGSAGTLSVSGGAENTLDMRGAGIGTSASVARSVLSCR